MNKNTGSTCEGKPGQTTCTLTNGKQHKPIEIYMFIDPLCPECWSLEPVLKKFNLEYGHYFTMRYIIGSKALPSEFVASPIKRKSQWDKIGNLTGMCCDADALSESVPSSYKIALAIKAAELQGKPSGVRYLRKLREMLFLNCGRLNDTESIIECAKEANLDIEEFKKDINSKGPIKSLLCDRRIADELDIPHLPTLVFFHADAEKEGIKVTGRYPYDIYVQILTEMLGHEPKPKEPPLLTDFLKIQHFVATKELQVIYDRSEQDILREMKKLQLKQIVESVPVKHGSFWRYLPENNQP